MVSDSQDNPLRFPTGRPTRLVVFSDDWGRHPSSCQHLVRHLLADHEVLWVNTVGTRRPSLTPADLSRAVGKMRQWTGKRDFAVGSVPEGLRVIAPKMWPGFRRPWQRRMNAGSIAWQVNEALGPRRDEQRIAITTLPITADLVGRVDVDRWVYYCVDDFSVWPGLDSDVMRAMERELLEKVQGVVAVSATLQARLSGLGRVARLLTHGIDCEHWKGGGEGGDNKSAKPQAALSAKPQAALSAKPQAALSAKPQALSGAKRRAALETGGPVAMFWGLIDRRLDTTWCQTLAQTMQHIGGTLVLAGPWQSPDPAIHRLPNTQLPGAVAYEDLPGLAAQADVLVMPYADAPVTRAMQPLKLKEYLATGKPVVVRDLPATRGWRDAADVVGDVELFVQRVQERQRTGLPLSQAQARGRLAGEAWSEKARQFASIWAEHTPDVGRRAA